MKRNYGIDLLRILSMFMIPILHVLGQGGILKQAPYLSNHYEIAWFLEIICYCAVDCFGLISGYIAVNSTVKFSRLLVLWLQVAFYSISISFLFTRYPGITISEDYWKSAFFPVITNQYWYFTAYFGLFFFMPFLNKLLNALEDKELKLLGLSLILVFSIIPIYAQNDIFLTKRGYSLLWLCILYLLGGILKKTNFEYGLKKYTLFFIYIGSASMTWGIKYYIESTESTSFNPGLLISYTSPTILLCAISLLLFFSTMTFRHNLTKRCIAFWGPLSFSVYIIHTHPLVFTKILKGLFLSYCSYSIPKFILYTIASGAAIYFVCALLDCVRKKLFDWLHISSLCSSSFSFLYQFYTSRMQRPI